MRVAIINLTGGGMSGGYHQYLRNILTRITTHSEIENILCISPKQWHVQDWFNPLSGIDFLDYNPYRLSQYRICPELEHNLVKFLPDVIFVPTERYFKFRNVPLVNMVQNMEPFVYSSNSNKLSERIKTLFRKRVSCSALHKSQRIIAVSKFVKEHLVTNIGIPETKISIIYHGCSSNGNNICTKPSAIPDNWSGTFLFTAGSIRPARGLEDILLALNHISEADVAGLVIAGYTTPQTLRYREKLMAIIERKKINIPVIWADSLNPEEMSWCYQNCKAFVMTSRVESFGMIAVEAMSHGCVCISSDNPCLPEIFKDAAVYYSPRDSHSLSRQIQAMCHLDLRDRTAIADKAKKRASTFSWDLCVEKTVAELKTTIENFTLRKRGKHTDAAMCRY